MVRLVTGIVLAVVLAYPVDWMVWRVRAAIDRSGNGAMGSVEVSRMTVASLKGNKEEYYFDGTETVACSRSVFAQAGGGACWWVRRHPEIIVRY
jgi:hypothetical protein